MIKKFKLAFSALIISLSVGFALTPVVVHASPASDAICEGVGGCAENASEPSISATIKKILNLLSIIIGIISIVMVIIGGLKYVTSQGEGNAVKSAKNTILYALVGLVIVALSQSIVRFVLNKSGVVDNTNTNTTQQTTTPSRTGGAQQAN
jgi:cytochrome bd-type quinol oxidase subunit 2